MAPLARILIIDDDEVTLEMLAAALLDTYQVTTSNNGQEGLDLVTAQDFDLVLLDVGMPGMDGYQVCERLKAESRTADIPVIFLSARVNLEERLRGYQAGACDYLTKPFDAAELTTKIELAVQAQCRNKALNSQIDEAMNTVLSTANMYGEIGVVLELQRALGECREYSDIANAFFAALEKTGFDGCLRLCGKQGALSRNARAECSALENSLLDHIAKSGGASTQAIGEHSFFRYGSVLMLIRQLPASPSTERFSSEDIDRFARARDNIALMAEGILSRMNSLDIEGEKSTFERTQKLVTVTREALLDIAAQQHSHRLQMSEIFQRMNREIEMSFINLGLSESQEEELSETLRRHVGEALSVFDQSDEIETHLNKLIDKLGV